MGLLYRPKEYEGIKDINGLNAKISGRTFGLWIINRYNGYELGDLIDNPAYIWESIYRDEINCERNLEITEVIDNDSFRINVSGNYNYMGAIITNLTREQSDRITDFNGTNIYTDQSHPSWLTQDKIIISDINRSSIDNEQVDIVGNKINGLRKDLKFARHITNKISAYELIKQLMRESWCIEWVSYEQVRKIKAIESDDYYTVWDNPLKIKGREYIYSYYSDFVYNDFVLEYGWNIGVNKYGGLIKCNKDFFNDGLEDESYLCKNAVNNYRINNKYEYKSQWIKDDATALWFMKKNVEWFTKKRLIVYWAGDFKNYCQYEQGDIIKLVYPKYINNIYSDARFMIMKKDIVAKPSDTYILFKLIEIT